MPKHTKHVALLKDGSYRVYRSLMKVLRAVELGEIKETECEIYELGHQMVFKVTLKPLRGETARLHKQREKREAQSNSTGNESSTS